MNADAAARRMPHVRLEGGLDDGDSTTTSVRSLQPGRDPVPAGISIH